MRISSLLLALLISIAPAASAQDESVDYGGLGTGLPNWVKTEASNMVDVSISRTGGIWLAGRNGTIWFTRDGKSFEQESGVSGFGRIGAGDDSEEVGAVGANNHTLWFRSTGNNHPWIQTTAADIGDVAIGGEVWVVGTNGSIWYAPKAVSAQYMIKALRFKQVKAEGFCRIATHTDVLWAVGCNGTLWRYKRNFKTGSAWDAGEWLQTSASGMEDVAADELDTLWLVGKNGSVWKSNAGKNFELISPPGSGFINIGVGHGEVYAVQGDGSLWRYRK